ncbi:hypothetical protein COLSTE_01224 [Collinsella stercoris DSM 13279]|uniref:Uncharacterized protein n=1 Tax=Collinsella stercoris DSM 13279 TaxID=445975 RepID=B6GAX3_9ACTN|nr:hypothetical protein COLSTE_01224 [Collinsella stercoris DSM 13279]
MPCPRSHPNRTHAPAALAPVARVPQSYARTGRVRVPAVRAPVAHTSQSPTSTCRRASHGHVTVASPRELRRGEQPIRGTLVWFFIDFERRGRAGFFAQTPRHRALHRIVRRRRGL